MLNIKLSFIFKLHLKRNKKTKLKHFGNRRSYTLFTDQQYVRLRLKKS